MQLFSSTKQRRENALTTTAIVLSARHSKIVLGKDVLLSPTLYFKRESNSPTQTIHKRHLCGYYWWKTIQHN